MFNIRSALPEDGQVILAITNRAENFTIVEIACVHELWDDYLTRGLISGYKFILYEDRDGVHGFACYGPRELTVGAYDLYWIAVDPGSRGRGVGQRLMQYMEDDVIKSGGYLILIETSGLPSYNPAQRFYENRGYTLQTRIRDFYAPGDDLLVYARYFWDPTREEQPRIDPEEMAASPVGGS